MCLETFAKQACGCEAQVDFKRCSWPGRGPATQRHVITKFVNPFILPGQCFGCQIRAEESKAQAEEQGAKTIQQAEKNTGSQKKYQQGQQSSRDTDEIHQSLREILAARQSKAVQNARADNAASGAKDPISDDETNPYTAWKRQKVDNSKATGSATSSPIKPKSKSKRVRWTSDDHAKQVFDTYEQNLKDEESKQWHVTHPADRVIPIEYLLQHVELPVQTTDAYDDFDEWARSTLSKAWVKEVTGQTPQSVKPCLHVPSCGPFCRSGPPPPKWI